MNRFRTQAALGAFVLGSVLVAPLGASALTAWVLQYVLVYYPIDLFVGHALELPEGDGLAAVGACVVIISLVTVMLARRGIRVPI